MAKIEQTELRLKCLELALQSPTEYIEDKTELAQKYYEWVTTDGTIANNVTDTMTIRNEGGTEKKILSFADMGLNMR